MEKWPLFSSFRELVQLHSYAKIPSSWIVFLSDIRSSTRAIEAGRYKQVNFVGASCISAVQNALKSKEVLYTFGGDGATFVVSEEDSDLVTEALLGAQQSAKQVFDLDLRVGRVPLADLENAGGEIRAARVVLSPNFTQVALSGPGLSLAESWVKSEKFGNYLITPHAPKVPGNFSGLECRWQPVQSEKGEILAMVVQSIESTPERATQNYEAFLKFLDEVLGESRAPLFLPHLRLSQTAAPYKAESKMRWGSGWQSSLRFFAIFFGTMLCDLLWQGPLRKHGDRYKAELVANTDYRKFDGMLRMVLDISPQQREAILTYLEKQYCEGRLIYGTHLSPSALITCLVENRSQGKHLHFVDGNNGGYAIAARDLKRRISELAEKKAAS